MTKQGFESRDTALCTKLNKGQPPPFFFFLLYPQDLADSLCSRLFFPFFSCKKALNDCVVNHNHNAEDVIVLLEKNRKVDTLKSFRGTSDDNDNWAENPNCKCSF